MNDLNKMGIEEVIKYLKENKLEVTIEDGKITDVGQNTMS